MAEKGKAEFPLSIILRTVDKYSAGLKRANDRIDQAFKPYRTFGKELGKLSENLGLPGLKSSLAGVGREVRGLATSAATLGAVALGVGAHVFKKWVDDADQLRDVAKRVGLSIDSLAQLRFAGSLEGVEELDGALEKMSKGLGEAKAKSGQLFTFLGKVSPVLRKQVLAAKSNEEAFFLFADAMAKIKDPAKKAAFATAVFGRGGQPLINMLEQGSGAIREQMKAYFDLAGSQEAAANQADGINDALAHVKAGLDRVKASIIVGLGPSIEKIAVRMQAWLGNPENQKRITEWIEDFGTKLPGRINALVDAIREIGAAIKPVWDAIGGAKGALLAFVGIKVAPLISALLGVVAALGRVAIGIRAASAAAAAAGGGGGVAGQAASGAGGAAGVLPIAALAAVGAHATNQKGEIRFGALKVPLGQMLGKKGTTLDIVRDLANESLGRNVALGPAITQGFQGAAAAAAPAPAPEAKITVDFKNAPKGTRVAAGPDDDVDVDFTVGYQMGGMP